MQLTITTHICIIPDLNNNRDERAIDQSKADTNGEGGRDTEPDRQSLIRHEADDDQANETRHEANAEIELPDDKGIGQPCSDDRGQGRLAEDVEKVGTQNVVGAMIEKNRIISRSPKMVP